MVTVGVAAPPPPNLPPTVAVTTPIDGATFAKKASVSTTATAADADGTVARVEFLRNGAVVGQDTTSPYSWVWKSATPGTHTLTASATDNAGAAATSAPVPITVSNR
jgi:chitinase